ncbi:MAG: restriction endonuclease subunit S [Candidatus Riflebacteria bacterium HGW-Riflebacteria-2]|jgi:type I restriction enzyme S subunit|nr:MAG: restriction endonuclease subunit S [Candidatus Riflebacteria bacterium HGW-Riflebacteria-2]
MSWPKCRLDEYFEITSSKRVFKSEWKSSGVPFYRAREVVKLSQDGYVDNELFISEAMFQDYKSKYGVPATGDILITGVGTLGKVYIVREGDKFYFKDGNIIWLKKKKEIDSKYVDYAIKTSAVQSFIQNSSGATVGTYTISRANETEIPLPPLPIQKKIAAVLAKADELRRRREEQIKRLDDLLHATFLDMFGDPVTNPKGWPIHRLGEFVKEFRYGTSGKSSYEKVGYPILRIPNIIGDSIVLGDLQHNDMKEAEYERLRLIENDLLFVRTNGNPDYTGRCALIEKEQEGFVYASYLIRARIDDHRIVHHYLLSLLRSEGLRSQLKRKSKTSAGQFNINIEGLSGLDILLPSRPLQEKFSLFYCSLMRKKFELIKNSHSLENLFSSLMQRAFKGELDLK